MKRIKQFFCKHYWEIVPCSERFAPESIADPVHRDVVRKMYFAYRGTDWEPKRIAITWIKDNSQENYFPLETDIICKKCGKPDIWMHKKYIPSICPEEQEA